MRAHDVVGIALNFGPRARDRQFRRRNPARRANTEGESRILFFRCFRLRIRRSKATRGSTEAETIFDDLPDRHIDSRSGCGVPRVAQRSRAGGGSDDDFLDGRIAEDFLTRFACIL